MNKGATFADKARSARSKQWFHRWCRKSNRPILLISLAVAIVE